MDNKLTGQEIKILNILADVWAEYNKLEEYHSSAKSEFTDAIHRAEDLVMYRLAVRCHPELFYRKEK